MSEHSSEQHNDLVAVAEYADKLINQVLPQARHIVLDVEVANELCMLLRRLKANGVIE